MSHHNDALGAGYDAWKTTPPDERESDSDSGYTYVTACCEAEVADEIGDDVRKRERALRKAKGASSNWTPQEVDSVAVICDECHDLAEVIRQQTDEPFDRSVDCAGGGDGPED